MTTHDRCEIPPRSPTIVGSAVETIVWSREASSRTSISAPKIRRRRGAPALASSPLAPSADSPVVIAPSSGYWGEPASCACAEAAAAAASADPSVWAVASAGAGGAG